MAAAASQSWERRAQHFLASMHKSDPLVYVAWFCFQLPFVIHWLVLFSFSGRPLWPMMPPAGKKTRFVLILFNVKIIILITVFFFCYQIHIVELEVPGTILEELL